VDARGVVAPEGLDTVRRDVDDAAVFERDSVPLREKKRRVDEVRFTGPPYSRPAGDRGGEFGPRSSFKRRIAASHNVQG
jgi:hypothetical protein